MTFWTQLPLPMVSKGGTILRTWSWVTTLSRVSGVCWLQLRWVLSFLWTATYYIFTQWFLFCFLLPLQLHLKINCYFYHCIYLSYLKQSFISMWTIHTLLNRLITAIVNTWERMVPEMNPSQKMYYLAKRMHFGILVIFLQWSLMLF